MEKTPSGNSWTSRLNVTWSLCAVFRIRNEKLFFLMMSSTNWNTIISSYYICFNPYNFNTFSVIRLPSKVKSFIFFIFTFNRKNCTFLYNSSTAGNAHFNSNQIYVQTWNPASGWGQKYSPKIIECFRGWINAQVLERKKRRISYFEQRLFCLFWFFMTEINI